MVRVMVRMPFWPMVIFNNHHDANAGESEYGVGYDENGNNSNLTHGGGKSCKTLRSEACRHLHIVALWERDV